MSLIKSTQTVGITITGSLTHLHVNFDISIITWNVFMTVFTVKDEEVLCIQVHCKIMINEEYLTTFWTFCFLSCGGVHERFVNRMFLFDMLNKLPSLGKVDLTG